MRNQILMKTTICHRWKQTPTGTGHTNCILTRTVVLIPEQVQIVTWHWCCDKSSVCYQNSWGWDEYTCTCAIFFAWGVARVPLPGWKWDGLHSHCAKLGWKRLGRDSPGQERSGLISPSCLLFFWNFFPIHYWSQSLAPTSSMIIIVIVRAGMH